MRETSAGAVIFRMEKGARLYLMLHYPSGHWDFVKGKMEGSETPRQTVTREAREETGMEDLEFIDGFKRTVQYDFQFEGQTVHKKVIFYLARTRTSGITLSDEHLDFMWMGYSKAMRRATFNNAKSLLYAAEKLLGR